MKHYYAIEWTPYGRAVDANTGRSIFEVHRFDSKARRDAWVEDGEPLVNQKGHREARSSKDPEVRSRIEANERDRWDALPWEPFYVPDYDSPLPDWKEDQGHEILP